MGERNRSDLEWGARMSDEDRKRERELRDEAHAIVDQLVPESASAVAGRRQIKQMLSVRLDSEVVASLRELANERHVKVADLLRDAVGALLLHANRQPVQMRLTPVATLTAPLEASVRVSYWNGEAVSALSDAS